MPRDVPPNPPDTDGDYTETRNQTCSGVLERMVKDSDPLRRKK